MQLVQQISFMVIHKATTVKAVMKSAKLAMVPQIKIAYLA